MARKRQLDPDFFLNEDLGRMDPRGQLLFAGLWCLADREGKLEDKIGKIKASVHPYRKCDIDNLLEVLVEKDFILRYEVNNVRYIIIPKFKKYQHIHPHESKSRIPNPLGKSPDISGHALTCNEMSADLSGPSTYQAFDLSGPSLVVSSSTRQPNARTDGSAGRGGATSCAHRDENFWEAVRTKANGVVKKINLRPAKPSDRSLLLKICVLELDCEIPKCLLADAIEALRLSKSRKMNPWGYFFRCLSNAAEKSGKNLKQLLAKTKIPEKLLEQQKERQVPNALESEGEKPQVTEAAP